MREFLARLWDRMRRERLGRELAEELEFHRTQLERDEMQTGTGSASAARAARRRLGNTTRVTEESRERWSIPSFERIAMDMRDAFRATRRAPGFAATAIATLALGIGANAVMFGVVDQLMFKPFPSLRDPSTVHRVYLRATYRGEAEWGYGGEYTRYLDLQRYSTSFSAFAGYSHITMAIGVGEAARERRVAAVSATFWDFFDASPALGRYFGPAEDSTPVGAGVAVLGYEYWQTEFAGRDVRGEPLQVGHIPATIIGVAPRGFVGVSEGEEPAVYIPITLYAGSHPNPGQRNTYFTNYQWGWMSTMVRRAPGVSEERASADITFAYRRSWEAERAASSGLAPVDVADPHGVVSSMRIAGGPDPGLGARTAVWLAGVAAIVLLIACANVANLFLARAMRRQRETAVRLALGVSRSRLVRQAFVECLVLSMLGCAAGLVLAQWGGGVIRGMLLPANVSGVDVFTDLRTLFSGAVAAVLAATLVGLAPALLSSRGDLTGALKAGPREGTYRRSRVRTTLLVAQVSLSVALLVGAALFVRSLGNVESMRLGYDIERNLLVSPNMRGTVLDSAQSVALREALLSRVRAVPGVTHAAWATSVPLWSTSSTGLYVPGIDSVARLGRFTFQRVTPDYFDAMGTRVVRGRAFTSDDRAGAPHVVVVSESMANVLWPGEDALGKVMRVGSETAPLTTVVGIAEDIVQQQSQLTDGRRLQYYLPIEQQRPASSGWIVLRASNDVASQIEPVRRALQAEMPGTSYVTVSPMRDMLTGAQRSWRMGATLFSAFGLLALMVASIGLYGVVAYNVTQRMHELGVRVALGAQRRDILALVVGQGARVAIGGVVVGSAIAVSASRWIQPLLFQQSASDPVVYGVVGAVMLAVAVASAAWPAARAAGADPNTALRAD